MAARPRPFAQPVSLDGCWSPGWRGNIWMFNLGGTTRDELLAAADLVLKVMNYSCSGSCTSIISRLKSSPLSTSLFHPTSFTAPLIRHRLWNRRITDSDFKMSSDLWCVLAPVAFYVACSLPSCKAVEESRCYTVSVPGMEYMANPCPPTVPYMLSV